MTRKANLSTAGPRCRRRLQALAATVAAAGLLGCGGGGGASAPAHGTDVYVAGSVTADGGPSLATYWVNGSRMPLAVLRSEANAIAVAGADVYVAGWQVDGSGISQPTVWKNRIATILGQGAGGTANGVAVGADGKVFVVGTLGADASRKAALWVDGQAVALEGGADPSSGHAIALSGSDVIVAGELGDQACYWKNGVSFALSAPAAWPANTSVALAVVTEGVNAYFAGEGTRSTPLGSVTEALGWDNGTGFAVSSIDFEDTYGDAITCANATIYRGGMDDGRPTLWYNHDPNGTRLGDGQNGRIKALTASSTYRVYGAGYYHDGGGRDQGGVFGPDGLIKLSVPANSSSTAQALALVEH